MTIEIAHRWPVYGHDWAVDYLQKGMLHQRVRHAYLITGTSSIGKNTLAHAFAMALNCLHDDLTMRPCLECRSCKRIISNNHIDLIYPEDDGGSGVLKIDAVRSVTQRIAMKPYEARYRIAIIEHFDRAQPRAQDALLKTLEEPPPHAVLILMATNLDAVLSTIKSRSQIVYLRLVATDIIQQVLMKEYTVEEDDALLLARLSGGRIGWAIEAALNPEVLEQREIALQMLDDLLQMNRKGRFDQAQMLAKDKTSLLPLLELWLTYWRDVLLQAEGGAVKLCNIDRQTQLEQLLYSVEPDEARAALQATQKLIDQLPFNINLRLAIEVMFMDYPGLVRR